MTRTPLLAALLVAAPAAYAQDDATVSVESAEPYGEHLVGW